MKLIWNKNFYLFMGMALLASLASIHHLVFQQLQNGLLVNSMMHDAIPAVTPIASEIILIPLVLFLIWFCRGGRIGRGFSLVFIFNAIFSLVFLLFYQSLDQFGSIGIVLNLWVQCMKFLPIILVWGFINQHFTFHQAAWQYPFLVIFAAFAATGYSYLGSAEEVHLFSLFAIVIALSLMTLIVYSALSNSGCGEKESPTPVGLFYIAALGAVVFFLTLARPIPGSILMKYVSEVDREGYGLFMYFNSLLQMAFLVIMSVLSVVLGWYLSARGPKKYGIVGAAVLMGGLIAGLIGLTFPNLVSLDLVNGSLSIGMGRVVVVGAIVLFLGFIKELAFLGIDLKKRFSAKLAVDGVVFLTASLAYAGFKSLQLPTGALVLAFALLMATALAAFLMIPKKKPDCALIRG